MCIKIGRKYFPRNLILYNKIKELCCFVVSLHFTFALHYSYSSYSSCNTTQNGHSAAWESILQHTCQVTIGALTFRNNWTRARCLLNWLPTRKESKNIKKQGLNHQPLGNCHRSLNWKTYWHSESVISRWAICDSGLCVLFVRRLDKNLFF